jgi:hypothetical protein
MAIPREHLEALTKKYYEAHRLACAAEELAMGVKPTSMEPESIPCEPTELRKYLAKEQAAGRGDRAYDGLYKKLYPLDRPPPSKPPADVTPADMTLAFIEVQDPDGWSEAMEIIYPEKEEK